MSGVSFYGKKTKCLNIQARLNRREKEFKKWPAPTPYIPKLGGPSSQWKIFKAQNEAFNFARSISNDLSVFSCESQGFCDHHGQRLYLVTSYEQLWHYYRQLASRQRHHYEVIPEGSVCHLYFDLEFSKEHNQNCNGEAMVDIFIKYVCSQLGEMFQITCTPCDILRLDASTDHKFSQHLICHLHDTVFKDNIHAGRFVHKICSQLSKSLEQQLLPRDAPLCKKPRTTGGQQLTNKSPERATNAGSKNGTTNQNSSDHVTATGDTISQAVLTSGCLSLDDLQKLHVKDKEGRKVLICDQGVYTKNRNFRLYLSCKLGKDNPLVVARSNQYKVTKPDGVKRSPDEVKWSPDEQIFLDSLITNIQYHPGLRILSLPENQSLNATAFCSDQSQPKQHSESLDGHRRSPYPELDAFIESQLTQDKTQGCIRHWAYFSSGELMVYDISRNRWCGNIQRQHKSNNVIYIADLKRAVFYQKCHDPQCKAENYKSQEQTLPKHVLPAAYFDDLQYDLPNLDDISDADLLLAASQVEKTLLDISPNVTHQETATVDQDFDDDDDDLIKAAESVENTR